MMDVESVFRDMFGIKKDQDIVGLIEAAVNVAGLIVPDRLKKHRSRIVKLLFDEDPTNSNDLFSDDELGFDSDSDDDDSDKVAVSSPPKNVCTSLKIFKKRVELSHKKPTKKMMGLKYREEEAVKKAKRKIDSMDFPEPKKLCGEIDRSKVKPPSGNVRQRLRSSMERMKAEYVKPKYKLDSGLIF